MINKKIFPGLLLLALALTSFTINNSCESFFPQTVGTKWEITSYDDKNEAVSKSEAELASLSDIPGGLQANINIEVLDKKGKSLSKGTVTAKCENDKFYMDMGNMMPKDQMASIKDVQIEMNNQYLEFPSNPKAGETLPDSQSDMNVKMNGVTIMTMSIKLTNRKVEGFEDITTPAGTFSCVKYSYDSEMKSFKTITSHTVLYMAKNVGMVKSISSDENGKQESYTQLTSFTK